MGFEALEDEGGLLFSLLFVLAKIGGEAGISGEVRRGNHLDERLLLD